MRKLTITRHKNVAACLAKMKVYVYDASSSDIIIDGNPCRKIGDLKNGETKTFEIDESATRVYVIGDKLSKNYCNDYMDIPEGTEDIFLSGENSFAPFSGNAFVFDGHTDMMHEEKRKKNKKKGLVVGLIAVLLGAVIGYIVTTTIINWGNEKSFSSDGMNIVLTEDFKIENQPGFTTCLASEDVAVLALRESFTQLGVEEDFSLDEYGRTVLRVNNMQAKELIQKDGLTYFEYTTKVDGEDYRYYAFVYKSRNAFWLVQFALLDENVEVYEEDIFEWAQSITFDENS